VKERPKGGAAWTIRIWNRARTPNALAALETYVDGKRLKQMPAIFTKGELSLMHASLAPFSYMQADLYLRGGDEIPHAAWDAYQTIEIRVHPVRGRRCRFKFRRADLTQMP